MSHSQNAVKVPRYYAFGSYVLDCLRGVLWHDGHPLTLTPKVFELLATLVAHAGEVLGKDELIRRVWAGTIVEENNLARHISTIRKALGERPGQREYIATIPGVGYRFVADVKELEELPADCRSALTLTNGEAQVNVPEPEGLSPAWTHSSEQPSRPRLGRAALIAAVVVGAVGFGAAAAWFTIGS